MMNNVNYQNLNPNTMNINPELRQRLNDENQESYTALDKEKLKSDAVEIANKAKDNLQENFAFGFLRKLGVKNPKKFTSIILAIATVVGLAAAGNKLSDPSARLGEKIDDILLDKSNILGKLYGGISDFFLNIKKGAGKQLSKIPVVADIKDTMKNRKLGMQVNFFRGYERGPVSIFINTLNELMQRTIFGSRKDDVSSICASLGIDSNGILSDIPQILNKANAKLATLTDSKEIDAYKDILKEAANKLSAIEADDIARFDKLKKMVGDVNAQKFFDGFANGVQSSKEREFYSDFANAIAENLQKTYPQLQKKSKAQILALAKKNKLKKFGGPDMADFIGVRMGAPAVPLGQRLTNLATGTKKAVVNLPTTLVNTILHPIQTVLNLAGVLGNGFSKVAGDWWPVTIIEDIGRKIPGNQDWEFGRGNLFDSLIKFDAINGTGAKTLPGKIVQKVPTLLTESVSNFVNDKSGFGVFLGTGLIGLYDSVQDAPEDKKISTTSESFVNQTLSWAIQNPVTYAIIYNTASMKNLQGTGIGSRLLRIPGKIFGAGLGKDATAAGKLFGGGLRFMLFQQIISPKIGRLVDKFTKKVFKPYDPEQEARQKAIEEQKNKVIPELGITQEEFMEKIQKNPQALQQLQNNPELLKMMESNPKLLVDYLDGKDITKIAQNNPQTPNAKRPLSPSLANRINNERVKATTPTAPQAPQSYPQNPQVYNPQTYPQGYPQTSQGYNPYVPQGYPQAPQGLNPQTYNPQIYPQAPQGYSPQIPQNTPVQNQNNQNLNNNTNEQNNNKPIQTQDSATYIPSSQFVAGNSSTLSEEQSARFNERMSEADKALKRAEKFI